MSLRTFEIVVVGASGLTGKLVAREIARHAHLLGHPPQARWAVAGRNHDRTAAALAGLAGEMPAVLHVDLTDPGSLAALTRRTGVILNLAGPYTPTALGLIAACVETGTDYVDLSGEIPLLRDVIARFHEAAIAARVRIVQMAGWEAMPADLTTLLASRRLVDEAGDNVAEGPGAGGAIEEVLVTARFLRMPDGRASLSQAVSGGTLSSIVQMLEHAEARLIGQAGSLLPPGRRSGRPTRISVRPLCVDGRTLAPFVPMAFLNAPIVHRTAALRAATCDTAHRPALYREGNDVGPGIGAGAFAAMVKAWALAGIQRAIIGIATGPAAVRRRIAKGLRGLVPASGTGPSGRFLTDWEWSVRAEARTHDGRRAEAVLEGRGHPGYQATAAMIAEVGLRIARGRVPDRFGCLTPALALGSLDLDPWFVDGIHLR